MLVTTPVAHTTRAPTADELLLYPAAVIVYEIDDVPQDVCPDGDAGQNVLLEGVGGGFTWGSLLVKM